MQLFLVHLCKTLFTNPRLIWRSFTTPNFKDHTRCFTRSKSFLATITASKKEPLARHNINSSPRSASPKTPWQEQGTQKVPEKNSNMPNRQRRRHSMQMYKRSILVLTEFIITKASQRGNPRNHQECHHWGGVNLAQVSIARIPRSQGGFPLHGAWSRGSSYEVKLLESSEHPFF